MNLCLVGGVGRDTINKDKNIRITLVFFSSIYIFGIQFAIIYDETVIISINYCSLFSPKTLIQIGENIANSTISNKKLIIFTKFLLNFSKKYWIL